MISLAGGNGERARQAVDLVAGVIAVVLGLGAAAVLDSRRLASIQGAYSALFRADPALPAEPEKPDRGCGDWRCGGLD
ncbi:hypothetical protein [Arthrobacter sp. H35-D1]|uniref:hypothetical protein n=1 Tax=Arthrobacter sp. H35-D1 TaxID=3046202 RepID=UPI0024BAFF86|nr:hypothetical protein [Arthrobacter sp. H35-D1]MDJ0314761.1 hypothetical protein [Arthrobacter sp. H35-D1]